MSVPKCNASVAVELRQIATTVLNRCNDLDYDSLLILVDHAKALERTALRERRRLKGESEGDAVPNASSYHQSKPTAKPVQRMPNDGRLNGLR